MGKLDMLVASMEDYQRTYPEDAYILVMDREKIIATLPGEQLDFKLAIGTTAESLAGTVTEKALRMGKVMQEERGPERFGIGYISTASPVFEDGEVVGVLSAVVSNHKFETLRDSAHDLAAMVEQISATTDEIAKSSARIASFVQDTSELSDTITADMDKIQSVAQFVQDVAAQSHLLGLNAAIEAARAGEHGRGFSIVAEEIRGMSSQSKGSAKDIQDQIREAQAAVTKINGLVQEIAADTEEHSASIEELKAVFEHMAQAANELISMTRVDR